MRQFLELLCKAVGDSVGGKLKPPNFGILGATKGGTKLLVLNLGIANLIQLVLAEFDKSFLVVI
jgi:hypothetical protein